MDEHRTERRDFPRQLTALGAAACRSSRACGRASLRRATRQKGPE
jgi:hypothetical protein